MKTQTNLTNIANNHYHQVKPVKYWIVKYCGVEVFRNNDVRLCWNYIRKQGIKAKPQTVR